MKIIQIDIKNAYRKRNCIVRLRNNRCPITPNLKHPLSKIRVHVLREFIWLCEEFRRENIRPADVDLSILQEVIMKKLHVSQRKAYDFAIGLQWIDILY